VGYPAVLGVYGARESTKARRSTRHRNADANGSMLMKRLSAVRLDAPHRLENGRQDRGIVAIADGIQSFGAATLHFPD